jgi:hypothetical protein
MTCKTAERARDVAGYGGFFGDYERLAHAMKARDLPRADQKSGR